MEEEVLDKLLSSDFSKIEPIVKEMSDSDKQHYLDVIIPKLKEKNADVRWRAAVALGRIGDDRAIEPLIPALKDKDYIRNEAEKAIETICTDAVKRIGADAVKPLIGALNDESPRVRSSVARILGRIQDDKSVHALIEALKKEMNQEVRFIIRNALVKKIIHAGWAVDKKHAEKYNLDLEESLSTGRHQRTGLLALLEEYLG